MGNYRITIIAKAVSSLPRKDLEAKLVAALFDIETEEKISDGERVEIMFGGSAQYIGLSR